MLVRISIQQDKASTEQQLAQTQTLPHVQQQDKYKDKSHLQHVALTETSTNSALASGRWVLRQMNMQDHTSP
jgi:hypothetical protein